MPKRTDIKKILINVLPVPKFRQNDGRKPLVKTLTVLAGLLFFAILVRSECVTVTVEPFKTSSRSVRFTTLVKPNDKPFKEARIEIFSGADVLLYSLLSNDAGDVILPELPVGFFHIVASAPNKLRAEAELEITPLAEKQTKPFLLHLTFQPPPPSEFELLSKAVESAMSKTPAEKVQEFKGVVVDLSGATVAIAKIRIFPKGFTDAAQVTLATTDEKGRFSVPLSPGTYAAEFQFLGFRNRLVAFEIDRDGSPNNLQVVLEVVWC